jgi:hypothetical protein
MRLSRAARVVSFFGALAIGVGAAYVTGWGTKEAVVRDVQVSYEIYRIPATEEIVPVETESLLGVWHGKWDHNDGGCTIEIDRISGETYYGTLRKEGAVIAFAGTLDAAERRVFFRELKVIKLGPEMSEWSLGTNTGVFSPDGRTLTGTGIDKWGTYDWAASKD